MKLLEVLTILATSFMLVSHQSTPQTVKPLPSTSYLGGIQEDLIFLLSRESIAVPIQDTCLIWQAIQRNSDCEEEEIETTLRTGNSIQIISPNHGKTLPNLTIFVFNPNESIGEIKIEQENKIILERNLAPGMNEINITAIPGRLSIMASNGSFNLMASLEVELALDLPFSSPSSLYESIVNIEFLLKSEFYGEAYTRLQQLKSNYPDSYEVWAALTLLHRELGNEVLMREAAANAIALLPERDPRKIKVILDTIQ